MSTPSPSRRLRVPVIGDGTADIWLGTGPYRPKYLDEIGVTGHSETEYDEKNLWVTTTFHGDPYVLELIAQEDDVTEIHPEQNEE